MITCTPKLLSGQEWMMCMEWSLFFLICSFKLPSSKIHSDSLILYDKAVLVSVWFNPYWAFFFFANTNMFTQFLTMNALSFSRSSLCLHELPYNIPLWVDFWCLLHAWQQQRRATKTAAAQGVLTALCFPLLVISATPIRTRHSECIRPCACLGCALDVHTCTGLQKITNKIDREIEIGKQWRVGGIETRAKGKRQMVCKYRAHQRLISTGDVWHSP